MLITHSNGFRKNIFNYILYFDHIHPPYPFLANLSFPREPLPIYFHSCLNINEFVYAPTHTHIKFSIHMRENIIVFVNLAYFASYDTVFLDKWRKGNFYDFFHSCVCVHACARACMPFVSFPGRSEEGVRPLELMLQAVVSPLM